MLSQKLPKCLQYPGFPQAVWALQPFHGLLCCFEHLKKNYFLIEMSSLPKVHLVVGNLACSTEVGTRWSLRSFLTQATLWSCYEVHRTSRRLRIGSGAWIATFYFIQRMCSMIAFCVFPATYTPPPHSTMNPGFPVPVNTNSPGVRKAARFGVYQFNNSSNDLFLFKEWQINKAMVQVRREHVPGGPPTIHLLTLAIKHLRHRTFDPPQDCSTMP